MTSTVVALIFCLIIFECHALPKLKATTVEISEPVLLQQPNLNIMINSVRKSFRRKRNLGDVVPGIQSSRFTPGPKPYADGKSCLTGQNPFDNREAKLAWKFYSFDVGEDDGRYGYFAARNAFQNMSVRLNALHGPNCFSGTCALDLLTMSLVCGPQKIPKPKFEDDHSCLDGSHPPSEEEYLRIISEADLKRHESHFLTPGILKSEQNLANETYGKNCEQGACYYDVRRGSYVCGNSGASIQSTVTLLALTVTLSRCRNTYSYNSFYSISTNI